jgi:hypothetical protein
MNAACEQLRRLLTPAGPLHITVDESSLRKLSDALHNVQVTFDVSPATMNLCYFAICAVTVLALVRSLKK